MDIEKAEQTQARTVARVEELRGQLGAAALRDREALGAALVNGKARPASEADALQADLTREEENLEALNLAVDTAHRQIAALVEANRGDWIGRTVRELERSKGRYLAAIDVLEKERTEASDLATLVTWLATGNVSEFAGDALGGRNGNDPDRPPMAFSKALAELRDDAEHLASAHQAAPASGPLGIAWGRLSGPGVRGLKMPAGWGD